MIGEKNDYFAGPSDATTSSSLIHCYGCFYGCCYGRVYAHTKVSDRNVTIVLPGDEKYMGRTPFVRMSAASE